MTFFSRLLLGCSFGPVALTGSAFQRLQPAHLAGQQAAMARLPGRQFAGLLTAPSCSD